MTTRCLVVADRVAVGEQLQASLADSGFEVELCSQAEEASEALNEDLPDVILVDVRDHHGLRVLALTQSLHLCAPCLVLSEKRLRHGPLPLPLSPFLRVHSLAAGQPEWRSQIAEAVHSVAGMSANSMFRLTDYVQLAVITGLSVNMYCHLRPQGDVLVEVVGGDVWNAYAGELEGKAALVSTLGCSPRHVEVSSLRSPPRERQLRQQGWDVLADCARKMSVDALEPRKVVQEKIGAAVEREAASAGATGESGHESLDALLERGLAAALARDYQRAEEVFEEALALAPDDVRVKFNLDRVRQRLEQRKGR